MNFADFKKKASTDKEFAKKFADVKTPEELVKLAAAAGYIFTVEDIKNNTDVSAEELEQSAGGGIVKYDPILRETFDTKWVSDN